MSAKLMKIVVPEREFSVTNRQQKDVASSQGFNTVRRPTRGITLRDETFATMRLVAGDGQNLHVIDAGSRLTKPGSSDPFTVTLPDGREVRATDVYSNFLLQGIIEDRQEKAQILETFGEPYVFFFGERPRILGIQGILLNTWDFNWEAEWWANYDLYLRGTKCVENDARVYLAFDNTIVGGYILNSNVQKTAQERHWLQFQFNLFVTYYETFSNLGDAHSVQDPRFQGQVEVDPAYFKAQGPQYPQDPFYTMQVEVNADGTVGDLRNRANLLAEMKNAQPGQLAAAWKKLTSATLSALSTVGQIWQGEVVRVPDGFEGSFAYDDTVHVKEVQKQESAQVVTYSTFDQNLDEYVGLSSHYGSSALKFGKFDAGYGFSTEYQDVAAYGQGLQQKYAAQQFWRDAGVDPDPGLIGTLAKVVKVGRLGLELVNVAQGVVAYSGKQKAAVEDFTGGINIFNDVWGGMSAHAQDNPYPE